MKIAFLGTGLMGSPMVERLLNHNLQVSVYNRTKVKTENLAKLGAVIFDNPVDSIKNSDVVILMLSDFNAITQVLFREGISDYKDKTVIQMGTISPAENILLEERINKSGGKFIEAPVLGSIPQVIEGKLSVLVGGEQKLVGRLKSLLKIFGKVVIVGKVGDASATKLALNQLIATETAAFSMSLGYLLKKGIDINPFMKVLRKSALYATTFDKKLNNYLNDDYDNPNFPLKHLLKDVNIIESDFAKSGIRTEILKELSGIIQAGLVKGLAEKDYSSVFKIISQNKKDSMNY